MLSCTDEMISRYEVNWRTYERLCLTYEVTRQSCEISQTYEKQSPQCYSYPILSCINLIVRLHCSSVR